MNETSMGSWPLLSLLDERHAEVTVGRLGDQSSFVWTTSGPLKPLNLAVLVPNVTVTLAVTIAEVVMEFLV